MFKALLKVQFSAFAYRMTGGNSKKKRSKSRALLFALLMMYVAGVFAMMFGMFFSQIAEPFHTIGAGWLYFSFMGMLSFAMMFLFSVFMTGAQLYEARDNERLLAMPIPTRYILNSRIVALLFEDYLYELLIVGPAAYVWCSRFPTNFMWWISLLLIVLVLPFFAFAVSGTISYIVNRITSGIRNKTVMSVAFTILFLAVYFLVYSRMNTYIQSLVLNGAVVANTIYGAAKPIYWLGAAISEGNVCYLLLTILICVAAFAVIAWVLSATFIKVTTTKRGFSKIKYGKKEIKVLSPMSALVRKELLRIGSSSTYIMNAGMGVLFMVALAVFSIIKQKDILSMFSLFPITDDFILTGAALLLCLVSSMVTFSAPSISIEGKSIWIPLSVPVKPATVLVSKAVAHMYISVPAAVLASSITAIAMDLDTGSTVLLLLTVAAYNVFTAFLGVTVNVRHPKIDWASEVQAIKQSASLLICMLIGFVAVLLPGILYFTVLNSKVSGTVFVALYVLLLTAVNALMHRYLKTAGAKRFENIAS